LDTRHNPRILVVWSGRPGYVPAPVFSTDQLTIYSHHDRQFPGLIDPPRKIADSQHYDLDQAIRRFAHPEEFDLVCIGCDASENNKVRNLSAFSCPKVLMLTDTHHLDAKPISVALDYFNSEPFDAVVSLYNRDHLRWFGGRPGVRLGWHPCLTVRNIPREFSDVRRPAVSFVGNWRRSHPRRKHLMEKMIKDGIPFLAEKLNALGSANLYASSLLSFNCSLNNDLNMRIFEVISAGGCLLTDRLSEQSGLDQLFTEDQDYIAYGNYLELKEKVNLYLADPSRAIEIARNAVTKYRENYQPEMLVNNFIEWALEQKHPASNFNDAVVNCEGSVFNQRLDIYQRAMQLQLHNEKVQVLAIGRRAAAYLDDLNGLGRVYGFILETEQHSGNDEKKPMHQPTVTLQRAAAENWAMVVADSDQPHRLASSKFPVDNTFPV